MRWSSFKQFITNSHPQLKRILFEANPVFSKGFITFKPANDFIADHFEQHRDSLTTLACDFWNAPVKIIIDRDELVQEINEVHSNPVAEKEKNKLTSEDSSPSDIQKQNIDSKELHEIEKALINIFNAKDITNRI